VERIEVSFPEEAVIFQFAAAARLALKPTQLLKVWIREGRGGGLKVPVREAGYCTSSWL